MFEKLQNKARDLGWYLSSVGVVNTIKSLTHRGSGKPGLITVKNSECKHAIYLRSPSSDVLTYYGIFNMREYDIHANIEPKVIIDAGANIGLTSVFYANKFPSARIIAIEPEKENFDLLCDNVKNYKNIEPLFAALWNEPGEINLVDPGLGNWGFMTGVSEIPNQKSKMVRAVTVDQIMDEFGLDRIDILKVDIEGAEKEVFQDTSKWIAKVDTIIVELHERMKKGCNRTFYYGTDGFETEWAQGENLFLTKGNIAPSP